MPEESSSSLEPKTRCPYCNTLLEHSDGESLEEYCIGAGCDYYRAEGMGGEVIRER